MNIHQYKAKAARDYARAQELFDTISDFVEGYRNMAEVRVSLTPSAVGGAKEIERLVQDRINKGLTGILNQIYVEAEQHRSQALAYLKDKVSEK